MANKKKTLTSKSAQPSGKKPEQPKRSVKKDFDSGTVGSDPDDERTINALLDGSYHLPGNSYWYVHDILFDSFVSKHRQRLSSQLCNLLFDNL
jgi:hypothetical protein